MPIEAMVRAAIAANSTVGANEIRLDARLNDIPGLGSLDFVAAINDLEQRSGLTIPDSDAVACRTVADLVDLCTRLAASLNSA
jgi:acyl carrier protein